MLYNYNPKLNIIYSYHKIREHELVKKSAFEQNVLSYCDTYHLQYNPQHLVIDTLWENDNEARSPHLVNLFQHLKAGDLLIIQDISSITMELEEILQFYQLLEKKRVLLIVLNNRDYLSTYPPAKTLEEQRIRAKYRELVVIGYALGIQVAQNECSRSPGAPRIQVDEDVFINVYEYWDSHPNYSYGEACRWLEEQGHPYRYNAKTNQKEYTKFNRNTLKDEPLKISKQTFQNMVNRYRKAHNIEGTRRDVTGKYTLLAKGHQKSS